MTRTPGWLLGIGLAMALSASGASAIDRCSARVNAKTGAVEVGASGLVGSVGWSGSPAQRPVAFANAGECIVDGRARRCRLGGADTLAAITPPAECRVCVHDDGDAPCCAFLKGCTPGPRLRDASFAAGDPRICQGIAGADPACGPVGIWERVDGLVRLGYVSLPDLLVLDPDGTAIMNSRASGGGLECNRAVHTKGGGSEIILDPEHAGTRVLRFRLPDADTLVLGDGGGLEATFARRDAAPGDLSCGSFEVVSRVDGLPMQEGLGGLGFDGTLLWYSDRFEQEVAVNPTTGAVSAPIDLPGIVLSAEGQTLWMRDDARTSMSRLATNGAVLDAVAMPAALLAIGAAPDPARGRLFVSTTSQTGDAHPLLAMQTNAEPDTVIAQPDGGQDYLGITFDGESLWGITFGSAIVRIDPATGEILETFANIPGLPSVRALASAGNGDLFALGIDFSPDQGPTSTVVRVRP